MEEIREKLLTRFVKQTKKGSVYSTVLYYNLYCGKKCDQFYSTLVYFEPNISGKGFKEQL